MLRWQRHRHQPILSLFIPEHRGIPEVFFVQVYNRIFIVKGKRSARIVAVTDVLLFFPQTVVAGEYGDHASFRFAEAAGIIMIPHCRAGKNGNGIRRYNFLHRNGQVSPMQQILAGSVAPAHVPPLVFEGIVLVI